MAATNVSLSEGTVPSPIVFERPTPEDLEACIRIKHGDQDTWGWDPQLKLAHRYYNPDDVYEAQVAKLVKEGTSWLDIGCGRNIFPSNENMARILAGRAGRFVGLDPDETIQENAFVHEKVQLPMEEYDADQEFDLITMRMVAEHVTKPDELARSLHHALRPGGLTVIYTVNRLSPVPLLTTLVPMSMRHPIKKFLWGAQPKDTFPTAFKMNRRKRLKEIFAGVGMEEADFQYLDDCRTLARFKATYLMELWSRKILRGLRLRYPENCLMGTYRRGA